MMLTLNLCIYCIKLRKRIVSCNFYTFQVTVLHGLLLVFILPGILITTVPFKERRELGAACWFELYMMVFLVVSNRIFNVVVPQCFLQTLTAILFHPPLVRFLKHRTKDTYQLICPKPLASKWRNDCTGDHSVPFCFNHPIGSCPSSTARMCRFEFFFHRD